MSDQDHTDGFSASEREAMRQRAEELRSVSGVKGAAKKAREYEACLAAIDALDGLDALIAQRLHLIVADEAPHLAAKTWYGFPSYARGGKVIVFLQPSSKFDTRYATLGFSEDARLDDGVIWPTSFAVTAWNDSVDAQVRALVRRAASAAE
ncbi:hypothetical protein [Pseudoclavibacter sp. 13-3]|uniref:hypothetical protein n=1 Tax=Pseudoclavibacter sp. 13-3 TaxID=2901228 RepID=UPI001E537CEF|nr:hypothetical protein [Pseudoclavibacter sp. 13-3]MCD7102191.1 hypothetical protein [Pseudoclavibacter sp. 13-3]